MLLEENNQPPGVVMKQSYSHHPKVEYFPITAHPNMFYASYTTNPQLYSVMNVVPIYSCI